MFDGVGSPARFFAMFSRSTFWKLGDMCCIQNGCHRSQKSWRMTRKPSRARKLSTGKRPTLLGWKQGSWLFKCCWRTTQLQTCKTFLLAVAPWPFQGGSRKLFCCRWWFYPGFLGIKPFFKTQEFLWKHPSWKVTWCFFGSLAGKVEIWLAGSFSSYLMMELTMNQSALIRKGLAYMYI